MTDLEYIKKFSKIKIKDICIRNGINTSNVWSGKASKDTIKKVKENIESDIAKLYIIE